MPVRGTNAGRFAVGALLACVLILCAASTAQAQQKSGSRAERPVFNFVAGTQAIGGSYQFTSAPMLIEAAQAILDVGSNTIKFALVPDKTDPTSTTQPHGDCRQCAVGANGAAHAVSLLPALGLPALNAIQSI